MLQRHSSQYNEQLEELQEDQVALLVLFEDEHVVAAGLRHDMRSTEATRLTTLHSGSRAMEASLHDQWQSTTNGSVKLAVITYDLCRDLVVGPKNMNKLSEKYVALLVEKQLLHPTCTRH